MPLTPFSGLTVTIHLFVIFVYKLFHIFVPKSGIQKVKKSYPILSLYISILIIIVVVCTVLISALKIVIASVESEHSSLRYVQTTVVFLNVAIENESRTHALEHKLEIVSEDVLQFFNSNSEGFAQKEVDISLKI